MNKDELINVLIEIRNDAKHDPQHAMQKYNLTLSGPEMNTISVIELCQNMPRVFGIEIQLSGLIGMILDHLPHFKHLGMKLVPTREEGYKNGTDDYFIQLW